MKFCSQCGQTVATRVPEGDNRPRFVCTSCATVHYENPRIVAGVVVVHEGSILLCKRAIEPRRGFWTVPAGFMELGESLPDAAARETWEEANARVDLGAMIAVVDVIKARQVHIFFEGTLNPPDFGAGEETLEARLFAPSEIPWDDLAFPSVRIAVEHHLRTRNDSVKRLELATAPEIRFD